MNTIQLNNTVLLTSTKYFFFKFLKKNKKIGDYVDLANDQALVKYFEGLLSFESSIAQKASAVCEIKIKSIE